MNKYKLINTIPTEIFDMISDENIYTSNYNTIIIVWNINNICIELDLGETTFGYFIDIDNLPIILIESYVYNQENINILIKNLTQTLL